MDKSTEEIMREGEGSVEAVTSRTAAENESQSPHSPLPWHVNVDGESVHIHSDLSIVARVFGGSVRVSQFDKLASQRRQNAAFIVTSVNSHDALLAALKALACAVCERKLFDGDVNDCEFCADAHAAIKLAEGR